jgi:uncharacterized repeat protein (TIGR01451 family)
VRRIVRPGWLAGASALLAAVGMMTLSTGSALADSTIGPGGPGVTCSPNTDASGINQVCGADETVNAGDPTPQVVAYYQDLLTTCTSKYTASLIPVTTNDPNGTPANNFINGTLTFNAGACPTINGQEVGGVATMLASHAFSEPGTYTVQTDAFYYNGVGCTAITGPPPSSTCPRTVSSQFTVNGLTVAKSASSAISPSGASVLDGQPLTYTLTIGNTASISYTGTTVTDTLPGGVTVTSLSAGCTPETAAHTVTCTYFGTVGPGASIPFTITVVPTGFSPLTSPGTMTNGGAVATGTADVTGGTSTTSLGSNTVTTSVIPAADLSLAKSAAAAPLTTTTSPNPVPAGDVLHGQNVIYTLTETNGGPDPATTPTITDVLPAGQTLVSSDDGCTGTTTVSCPTATLPANSSDTIHITASTSGIPAPLYGPLPQTDNASVASTTADPVPGNNAATAMITVLPAADLAVTKTGTPNPVIGGQPLEYTLTTTNAGPDPALNTTLVDTLPPGEHFDDEGSSPACTANAALTVVTCVVSESAGPTPTVGPPADTGNVYYLAGSTQTFKIEAIPTNTGPGSQTDTNTVTFQSNALGAFPATADPNIANNVAVAVAPTITVLPSCTAYLTASTPTSGSISVPSGTFLCINHGSVGGAIIVKPGAALTVSNNSTIGGAIDSTGAEFLTVCGSTINGGIIAKTTVLGMSIGDDDIGPCAPNHITKGGVIVQNNLGSVELYGNTISGSVDVQNNNGATSGLPYIVPEVEGNTISGSLDCTTNIPAPTNDSLPNTVSGQKLHQCQFL